MIDKKIVLLFLFTLNLAVGQKNEEAKGQHGAIGIVDTPNGKQVPHTNHPDAQWYPDASFGLFIHWGLSSQASIKNSKVIDLSWPMIAGAWKKDIITDPKEQERIIRERDWEFNGDPLKITPNEYWASAKDFNPQHYDPDKWIKAAKDAGFTYAVLTTKHHEGYAMWPSKYGGFSTKEYMGGRDLVKPFVDACRKYGLKVGLYFSPPDWHFNRDFENFMYYGTVRKNPWLPQLDTDLNPRKTLKTEAEKEQQLAAFNEMIKGQVEELLTRYGKIDLLWFDGSIPAPKGNTPRITQERIRELQPGIVLSPRYFNNGDYLSYEGPDLLGNIKEKGIPNGWSEWCTTWVKNWDYSPEEYYANGMILGNLAIAHSFGINCLLGIGPDAQGELAPNAYKNMKVVADWMKKNKPSVIGSIPLPKGETANVPGTASKDGKTRYLFANPKYKQSIAAKDKDMLPLTDETLTLNGLKQAPANVILLNDGKSLKFDYKNEVVTIYIPVVRRTNLPTVAKIILKKS